MKTIADIRDNGKILFGDLTGQIYNLGINVPREGLDSLKGSPKEVKKGFNVTRNNLKSLEFGPEIVLGGEFDISDNPISSLEFAPTFIEGSFYCNNTLIQPNKFKEEVIKHRVKASYYSCGSEDFFFSAIEKEFEAYVGLNKRVTRKSMRTLLGLDK